jgi:hypothetical protein
LAFYCVKFPKGKKIVSNYFKRETCFEKKVKLPVFFSLNFLFVLRHLDLLVAVLNEKKEEWKKQRGGDKEKRSEGEAVRECV